MSVLRTLVDTNVILDVLGRREPHYTDAVHIWTLAETGKLAACVSAVSFTNVFYIIRRFRDVQTARQAVRWMRDTFQITACNDQILSQAIDADWPDLEDAVQYFSAWHAGASCIVTRNASDFKASDLNVLTPEEFLAQHYMTE